MNRVPFSAERGPSGKIIWKPHATGNASQKVAPAATRPTANSTRSKKSRRSVSKRSNARRPLERIRYPVPRSVWQTQTGRVRPSVVVPCEEISWKIEGKNMKPETTILLRLISGKDVTFFIPPYQRNYEWMEEQCSIFFNDLVKNYYANKSINNRDLYTQHFLGTIIYFQEESSFVDQYSQMVLIDGQQRITTTMLLIASIRDTYKNQEKKNSLDRYLKNENFLGEKEHKIKLKQVKTDWEPYRKIILGEPIEKEEDKSYIYYNYRSFKSKIKEFIKENQKTQSEEEHDKILDDLINKGLASFSVIAIELQPQKNEWEKPQEIFESMNSLGKPLTLADLVRNYLFLGLKSEEQDNLYEERWMKIEQNISSETVSGFIRDYMQFILEYSIKTATESNYKDLYHLFKKTFQDNNSEDILKSLHEFSLIYAYLLTKKKTGVPRIDRVLKDLNYLKVTTAYSFLMGILHSWKNRKLSDDDLIEILGTFKIYCVRRRLMGLTQGENRAFPPLTKRIEELIHAPDKKQQLFKILAQQEFNLRIPNDDEISHKLENSNFYNFKYSKYILALIEEKITKEFPDISKSVLQIEHIMPRKLNRQWKSELGDNWESIHQKLLDNIGNLTLVRHNQELGNKSFFEKKKIYSENTSLKIAEKYITDCISWNEETIKRRSNWIKKYLLDEVLPIPYSMKSNNNFSADKNGKKVSITRTALSQLIGEEIVFIKDPTIRAKVIDDEHVIYNGKKYFLSALTREIFKRKGTVNKSGAYQGAVYWTHRGVQLAKIGTLD